MSAKASGGCQCGAVRFRGSSFGRASICHCRMCQKAFGGFFGALVTVHDLEWTRGAPRTFQSSNKVKRGFCGDCGTPLSYDTGGGSIEIAVGAFDDPNVVPPVVQVNPADKLAFFDGLCSLPTRAPGVEPKQDSFNASVVSFQHPDHDTAEWLPRGGR
jgi:hypothetical protein